MTAAKSYFDTYAHHHAYHQDPNFYFPLLDHIKRINPNNKIRILDLGCGDGTFIKSMIMGGVNAVFIGSDISSAMISMAKEKLSSDQSVELLVADGFKLPLNSELRFDVIHIDRVLHHLIGKTISKSLGLAEQMIDLLIKKLSANGVLVIEEVYYVSYLIPKITSSLVFYGLKFLNSLHLDLSNVMSECQPGLEVNFFCDQEIEKLLKARCETLLLVKKHPVNVPKLYRFFLLKEFGHISYMVTARYSKKSE